MTHIHLDFETRSTVDIRKTGAWRYAESDGTEILCLAVAFDDEPAIVFSADNIISKQPQALWDAACREDTVFIAHNAFFEQAIWTNIMVQRHGWPEINPHQWRCTAAKAASYALPRALGKCGEALRLPVQKSDEGHRVMMQLAKPRRTSKDNSDEFWERDKVTDKFRELFDYCRTDVEAERAIDKSLRDLNEVEQKVWLLDQKINRRGIQVDIEAVTAVLDLIERMTEEANETAECITAGDVTKLTQRARIVEWIESMGVEVPGLTKADVQALLAQDLPERVSELLQLRQQVGKTSTAKYKSLLQSTCEDGRLRDTLVYHGASTGRWSGKTVQLQNIPRGSLKDVEGCIKDILENDTQGLEEGTKFGEPFEALSSCLRGMFTASPGHKLVVADYSAIEARVLVWLAGDKDAVDRFAQGVDTYVDMASLIYGCAPEEVTPQQRQLGKQAVLGCGYGMGAPKFQKTCATYNMEVDEDLAERAVEAYRKKYKAVTQLWYGIEEAAQKAIRSPGEAFSYSCITWKVHGRFLYARLPSGRLLSYCEPKLASEPTWWGEDREQISFMGVNSVTRKWERQSTYGGKLTENITQAVARDVMAWAMLRVEDEGFKILLSVHDELVTEIPEETPWKNPVERLEQLMSKIPDWGHDPVIGQIPISAEGWSGFRYRK